MKSIWILILMIALGLTAFSQEAVKDQQSYWQRVEKNRFSLGLNNMPWDASRLSFRWWRNKHKGMELTISVSSRAEVSNPNTSSIHISEIRYDYLWRKRSRYIRGLYHVRGIGLSMGFDAILNTRESSSLKNSFNGYFTLYVPFGIEHFFLKSFPKLSYSLQLDLYGRVRYRHYTYEDYKDDWFDRPEVDEWAISLGLKFQFFIRLYLK